MKKLILLVGTPGCGKSTWFTQNYVISDWALCSADHWFERTGTYIWDPTQLFQAHRACMAKCDAHMKDGVPVVVVDNTNIRARDRKPYLEMAKERNYEVFLKVFPPPDTNRNVHGVTWEQVLTLQKRIQFEAGWYQYSVPDDRFVPVEDPCSI